MCGPPYVNAEDAMRKECFKREKSRRLRLEFGEIRLAEDGITKTKPDVSLTNDNVEIGCTTVSRAVVEKLAAAFQEHFPVYGERRVKLQ